MASGQFEREGPPAAKRHCSRQQLYEADNRKSPQPAVIVQTVPILPGTICNLFGYSATAFGGCGCSTSCVMSYLEHGTDTLCHHGTRTHLDTDSDTNTEDWDVGDQSLVEIPDMTNSPSPNKYSSSPPTPPTDRVQRRRGRRYRHLPHTPDISTGPAPSTTTSPGTTTTPVCNNSMAATLNTSNGNSSQEMTPGASSAHVSRVHVAPSVHPEWAHPLNIWSLMEEKEAAYPHSASMLDNHPDIVPRSRALVLTCMMAMCVVHKFVKETYFLAVDLHDRFLLRCANVSVGELPLVGTTALFLAAKVEERKTTKQYLRLAAGDITTEMIISYEKVMLRVLDWKVNPVTAIQWAGFYFQLVALKECRSMSEDYLTSHNYSNVVFCCTCRLLELCMVDISSLKFKYSELAACAVCHTHPDTQAVRDVILPRVDPIHFATCKQWMEVFATSVEEEDDDDLLQRYSHSHLLDEALDISHQRF